LIRGEKRPPEATLSVADPLEEAGECPRPPLIRGEKRLSKWLD